MLQLFQAKHVFEQAILSDMYHTDVVKETLLKKLPGFLPNAVDEVFRAVNDNIPIRDNRERPDESRCVGVVGILTYWYCAVHVEWESVDVTPVMGRIFARTSSRVFVGLPLCACTHIYFLEIFLWLT